MACEFEYKGQKFQSKEKLSDHIKKSEINLKEAVFRINTFLNKTEEYRIKSPHSLFSDIGFLSNNELEKSAEYKELKGIIDNENTLSGDKSVFIQNKIDAFLSNIGVRVEYGKEKGVNGVANLLEGFISMREGYTTEEMLEELSHFLIEMWSGSNLESYNYSDYVRSTVIYKKNELAYRAKYASEGLSGEALERKIDLEILGKILAEQMYIELTSNNSAQIEYNGFFGEIKKVIREFLDFVFNNKSVDNLLSDIYKAFDRGDIESFSNKEFRFTKYYSLKEKTGLDIRTHLANLRNNIRSKEREQIIENRKIAEQLQRDSIAQNWSNQRLESELLSKANFKLDKGKLVSLIQEGDAVIDSLLSLATSLEYDIEGMHEYISIWAAEIKQLNQIGRVSANNGTQGVFSTKQIQKANFALTELREELSELKGVIQQNKYNLPDSVKAGMFEMIVDLEADISQLEVYYLQQIKLSTINNITEEMTKVGADQSAINKVLQNIKEITKDINTIYQNFMSLGTSSDAILGHLYQIINNALTRISNTWSETYNPIIKKITQNTAFSKINLLISKSNGKANGWMIHQYDQEKVKEYKKHFINNELNGFISKEKVDAIVDGANPIDVLETEEELEKYYNAASIADQKMIERPWEDDFYEAREQDIINALQELEQSGVLSGLTDTEKLAIVRKIKSSSGTTQSRKAEIYSKYRDAQGKVSTNFSPEDLAELNAINLIYKLASAKYTRNGVLKRGLDYHVALVFLINSI